jgi:hypothetical protein
MSLIFGHHDTTDDRLAPTLLLGYHCPLSMPTSNDESNVIDWARWGKDGSNEYAQRPHADSREGVAV